MFWPDGRSEFNRERITTDDHDHSQWPMIAVHRDL